MDRLAEELQRRHMVVIGVPPTADTEAGATQTLLIANAEAGPSTPLESNADTRAAQTLSDVNAEAGPSTRPTADNEGDDEASVDPHCNEQDVKYSNPVKQLMLENGLYKRHSLDHPLLKEFANYLNIDLNIKNYKQEVENVARYLYSAVPDMPSLQFVYNRQNIQDYLRKLSEASLKKRTQQNYLKSLKRFLSFHTVISNLQNEDEELYKECKEFIALIGSLQQILAMHSKKEITQKRFD